MRLVGCRESALILLLGLVLGESKKSTQASPIEFQQYDEASDSTEENLQNQASRSRIEIGMCWCRAAQNCQKQEQNKSRIPHGR